MTDLTRSYRSKVSAHIAMTEDHWKLFLLQGAGLILLGVITAILPNITVLPIGALIGWMLLIGGLFRLASGFGAEFGPGHWSSMLLSALMVLLGAALAFYSKESDFELTVALAAYFALHALASLVLAASLRRETSTWVAMIIGAIIDVLLVSLMLAQWPSTSTWVFGVYLGVNLAVTGLALSFVALGAKNDMQAKTSLPPHDPPPQACRRSDVASNERRHDQQTRA